MAAIHPQLTTALANVAAWNAMDSEEGGPAGASDRERADRKKDRRERDRRDERNDRKDKKHKGKDKATGKDRDKDRRDKHGKDKGKDDKDRRRREAKKAAKRTARAVAVHRPLSSLPPGEQLSRMRAATAAARDLLFVTPSARADLRSILAALDAGGGVSLDAVTDLTVRAALRRLFESLALTVDASGTYSRAAADPPVLRAMAPVLAEDAATIAAHGAAMAAATAARDAAAAAVAAAAPPTVGPPPPTDSASSGDGDGGDDSGDSSGGGSPQRLDPSHTQGSPPPAPPTAPPPRQPRGPAIPPPEILAAAAAVTAAGRWDDGDRDDDDSGPLVGPPPPALAAEVDALPADARTFEVGRLIAASTEPGATPYVVLGVPRNATAGDIKRRYWRVSLLVHPDKCGDARAPAAFAIADGAAKALGDAATRAALDDTLAAADHAAAVRAALDGAREAAEWRRARGQPALPDDAMLLGGGGQGGEGVGGRAAWMTDLPPERRERAPGDGPDLGAMQVPVVAFSRRGRGDRGDASGWTDTPMEREAKQHRLLLAGYAAASAVGAGVAAAVAAADARTAAEVDAYDARRRGASLVERHTAKIAEAAKAKKKRPVGAGAGAGAGVGVGPESESWAASHPWKPWDREKELEAGAFHEDPREMLKKRGALGDRFGAAGGAARSFL